MEKQRFMCPETRDTELLGKQRKFIRISLYSCQTNIRTIDEFSEECRPLSLI